MGIKKTKPSRALVKVSKREPKKLSKKLSKVSEKLSSILGDSSENILGLLEANNSESASNLILTKLMQSLVDTIPYAENNVRKTRGQKGVYQLNSLVQSLRELMIDMQAVRDKGLLGERLVEKIIRPAFMDIGKTLVEEDDRMYRELRDQFDSEAVTAIRKLQKESIARIAEFMNRQYSEVKEGTIAFIQN